MYRNLSRELNSFAVPLIMNNLFSVFIATIMSSIIGNISPTAIVSAGIIDGLMYTILGVLGVGTLSFNIYASRVRQNNPDEFKDYFKSILLLNGVIGIIFVFMILLSSNIILKKIYLFSGNQLMTSTLYAKIVSFKVFFNMLIFAMSNQMKVNKKTHDILKIGIISSIFQIISSIILVYYVFSEEYKILGVGISSTLSMLFSVCAYVFILRNDIALLKYIKSSKKRFLLKKSIPLFSQELLEGSIMEVLITIFLSRLGNIYAAYLVCMNIINISLIPMFMYCNAIVVLVGEKLVEQQKKELTLIPKISLLSIVTVYIVINMFVYPFRKIILSFFTNDSTILIHSESLILFIILISLARPLFEVYKYSLQSFGNEKLVLFQTCVINSLAVILLLLLNNINFINLYTILITVAINYIVLAYLFRRSYLTNINNLH